MTLKRILFILLLGVSSLLSGIAMAAYDGPPGAENGVWNGPTYGTFSKGNIAQMTGGHISLMTGTGTVNRMDRGTIGSMQGNARINTFHGNMVSTMEGNATIHKVHSGLIGKFKGEASIGSLLGGNITTMEENASISEMYGGTVATMNKGTIASMHGGTINELKGGTVNFAGQNAVVKKLTGTTTLGFHVNSPTDYARLTFLSANNTAGSHKVSLLMGGATGIQGQDFTLDLIDQSASPSNKTAIYTLADAPTRFGAYDYEVSEFLDSDIYSVMFRGLGMNPSDKDSLSGGVGNGLLAGMTQMLTATETVGKRLGELRFTNLPQTDKSNGLWLRQYARRTNADAFEHTSITTYGLEGGYDRKLSLDIPASIHLGVAAGMGWSQSSSNNSDTKTSSPSVGIYATALFDNDIYVDFIARHHWLSMKSDVDIYGSQTDSFDEKTNAVSFNLETGKQFFWGEGDISFFLQPRIQYNYAHINSYGGTLHGIDVKAENFNSSLLSAGFDAGLRFTTSSGAIVEPFVQLNGKQEFDGTTRLTLNDEKASWSLAGFRGEGGVGIKVRVNEGFSFYGEGTYEKGEQYESAGGNIGLQLHF